MRASSNTPSAKRHKWDDGHHRGGEDRSISSAPIEQGPHQAAGSTSCMRSEMGCNWFEDEQLAGTLTQIRFVLDQWKKCDPQIVREVANNGGMMMDAFEPRIHTGLDERGKVEETPSSARADERGEAVETQPCARPNEREKAVEVHPDARPDEPAKTDDERGAEEAAAWELLLSKWHQRRSHVLKLLRGQPLHCCDADREPKLLRTSPSAFLIEPSLYGVLHWRCDAGHRFRTSLEYVSELIVRAKCLDVPLCPMCDLIILARIRCAFRPALASVHTIMCTQCWLSISHP